MKLFIFFSVLFCAIVLPALGELTDTDLDKMRLIVKEEIKKEITVTNTKIDQLDTRLRVVEAGVSWVRGKLDTLDKHINWFMALILVAVGLPQIIIAGRSRKDRALEKQIETLTQEIEILKQQRTVSS